MPDAGEQRIKEIIAELDALLPKEGALAGLPWRRGFASTGLRANKRGFLRLGIELIKAAYAPGIKQKDSTAEIIDADLDYLQEFDQSIPVLVRDESLAPEVEQAAPAPRVTGKD